MNNESYEIWYAMKESKFNSTLRELEGLSQAMSDSTGSIDSYLRIVLETVAKAAHCEVATLWYYRRYVTGRVYPIATYGGADIGDFSLLPGEGVSGNVIQTGEPVIIQDCQEDPRWSGKVDSDTGFVTRSMICVPLKNEGDTFGCIQIINRVDGELFDEKDLNFVVKLGDAVSGLFSDNPAKLLVGFLKDTGDDDKYGFDIILNTGNRDEMLSGIRIIAEDRGLRGMKKARFIRLLEKLWRLLNK